MKILVVCQYYYPERFQIIDICEQMAQNGHDVTVLTGLPNYPNGIIPEEYRHRQKRDENINGVHVIRSFEIGRRKGAIGFAANYISFCISASQKAKRLREEFDVVFVYQLSPVIMAKPAVIYKRKHKTPIMLYCCDIWPESMKMYIKNENNIVFKFIAKISRQIYQQCDLIAVQSPYFIDYFKEQNAIKEEQLCYIPHFASGEYLDMDLSADNDENRPTNFMFMGNIGVAQDIDCILKAACIVAKCGSYKLHFVGEGTYLNEAKILVNGYGLNEMVVFHGRQPYEMMSLYYKIADAFFVTLKNDSAVGLTIPSKLQGAMAAGKYILGAIDGGASDVINAAGCGRCVPSGDYCGLAESMQYVTTHRLKCEDIGKNGKGYFRKYFDKKMIVEELVEKMTKLKYTEY